MSEPLKSAAPERQVPVAAMRGEPDRAAQAEAAMREAEHTAEPDFFDDYDQRRAAVEEKAEAIFDDEMDADDLPPPAYRPETVAAEPQRAAPEEFVAPTRPAPGTPSPEALARLRAAVRKSPGSPGEVSPRAVRSRRREAALRHQLAHRPDDRG
jgi:cell division protein FtsZ